MYIERPPVLASSKRDVYECLRSALQQRKHSIQGKNSGLFMHLYGIL